MDGINISSFEVDSNSTTHLQNVEKNDNHSKCPRIICVILNFILLAIILLLCALAFGIYLSCQKKPSTDGINTVATYQVLLENTTVSAEKLRLPQSLKPVEYHLQIKSFIPSDFVIFPKSKNFTFAGFLKILLECHENTNQIVLNSANLNITPESVNVWQTDKLGQMNATPLQVIAVKEIQEGQMVLFQLKHPLISKKFYFIQLSYVGQISESLAGYYKSSYIEDGKVRWLTTTQFSPIDARRTFPSFDEPNFKAVFNIEMVHPKDYTAISNGEKESTKDIGNGWVLSKFAPSPQMSTYIVGFTLCHFEHTIGHTENGVIFRVWARKSQVNNTKYAAKIGPKVLDYFEKYLSVKFPLEKQDMIAIPDFEVAGMENWGMINFRENLLVYNPELNSLTEKQKMLEVMTHELGHMWFGNLVTMEWFSDVWLKEGFATIMEHIGMDSVFNGSFKMNTQIARNFIQLAMTRDQLASSHPLSMKIEKPYEVYEIFDDISYRKKYLKRYSYKNAEHNDVWNAMTDVIHEQPTNSLLDWEEKLFNVTKFAEPWTLQMGFPLVQIREDYTTNVLTITQQHFKLDVSKDGEEKYGNSSFGYFWQFMAQSITRYQWFVPLWLKTNSMLDDNITWIKPGKSTQIQLMVIFPATRSQLLDDAFTLAKAGILNYSVALNLATYLPKETEYVPWSTAMSHLLFISDMFAHTSSYGLMSEYMKNILTFTYNTTGWDFVVQENDVLKENMQTEVIAYGCLFGMKHCIDRALYLFKQLRHLCSDSNISGNCNSISPQLKTTVYCTAVKQTGSFAWEFFWKKFQQEHLAVEKIRILEGLACAKEIWLLNKLLDQALYGSFIRRQSLKNVFSYVSRSPLGREILWNFFANNWNEVFKQFGNSLFSMGRLISTATHLVNDKYKLQQLKDFLKNNPNTSKFSKFQSQIEKAGDNMRWMEKNFETFKEWITNKQ